MILQAVFLENIGRSAEISLLTALRSDLVLHCFVEIEPWSQEVVCFFLSQWVFGRSMPSFFNLESRVVRFISRISAAPEAPPTRQLHLLSTLRI